MTDQPVAIPVLPNLNEEACRVCDAYLAIDKSKPPIGKCVRNPPQAVPSRFHPEMLTLTGPSGEVRQQASGDVIVYIDGAWPLVRPEQVCRKFKRKMSNGTGGVSLPDLPILGEKSDVAPPADVEAPE